MEKANKKQKVKKLKVISERVLTDCYEFLHLIEVGRGSMQDLMEVLGKKENLEESNYRQIERIKQRCQQLGVEVYLDVETNKYYAEPGSKIKLLDNAEKVARPNRKKKRKQVVFGPYVVRKEDL